RQLFQNAKPYGSLTRFNDLGQVEPHAVADFVLLAGLGAKNAREMLGFIARELGLAAPHFVHIKPPPRHNECLRFMFAYLRGAVLEKHPNQVIVDVGGVGYDVTIAVPTYAKLPDVGSEVRLRIHTHVREDALALYGFLSQDEKALFEKLISV